MKSSFNVAEVYNQNIKNNNLVISEVESKSILSHYGIPTTKGKLITTPDQITEIPSQLSFPLVAKISAKGLLHKTEIGGVITDINNSQQLVEAFNTLMLRIQNNNIQEFTGILIEEQVFGSVEIIAGFTNDTVFGPIIMAGTGGIYTNLLNDVAFHILPATEDDIYTMLRKLKGYPLIEGYRGNGINLDELISIFMKLCQLAQDGREYIHSIDCNPIIANRDRCIVADASITLLQTKINDPLITKKPNTSYMDTFFNPESVAVVGASSQENKIGHVIVDCLKKSGYKGSIYPINPKQESILGLPAFSSIKDTPQVPDVVIIAVDLSLVPDVLDEMAAIGSHNAIIISGGGKELGGKREELEATIATKAQKHAIRIIGPNCIGVFDSASQFDSFFYHIDRFTRPPQGNISFITQSGTWGVTFMELSHKTGLAKMISYGNRVDLDEGDMIAYLASDTKTAVIASYIEGLGRGRKFLESVAIAHNNKKPVVVFKTGRTPQAAHASISHTGAYGGSYTLYHDILEDAGILLTDSMHECFAASVTLSMQPAAKGNRVAMVSNGAGPMVNALDLFSKKGLELASLCEESIQSMKEHFSFFYIVNNPVDITGSATSDDYDYVMTQLMNDDGVDIIMPFFVFQNTPLDEAIIEKMAKHNTVKKKPVICCCTEGAYSYAMKERLIAKGIPVFTEIHHWVTAAYAVMQWGKIMQGGSVCKSSS